MSWFDLGRPPRARESSVDGRLGDSTKSAISWGPRLPPGQKLVRDWPVLTYGPDLRLDLEKWRFQVGGLVEEPVSFTWQEFLALPQADLTSDIHCVTGWSRYDNRWEGVPVQELMKRVRLKPEATAVMVYSYGGYTTNLLLEDLLKDGVLFAHRHDGQPLPLEHGGPLRLVVPHLYFWKSAKWAGGLEFMAEDTPGFWERYGYHIRGDPWREERYS